MRYTFSHWQCFDIDSKEWKRVRLFVGLLPRGMWQVTGDIVDFDPAQRLAGTSLGNEYVLSGQPGLMPDAQERWQSFCEKNRFTGVVDVRAEITKLMEQK